MSEPTLKDVVAAWIGGIRDAAHNDDLLRGAYTAYGDIEPIREALLDAANELESRVRAVSS